MNALLAAEGITKAFGATQVLSGITLSVAPGEPVGLFGPNGSGKTTLVNILSGLLPPDAGTVRFDGTDLTALAPRPLRRMRRHFQIVFQDPTAALNPRMRVGTLVGEPLAIHRLATRADRPARVAGLLRRVGLDPACSALYPQELSGGQRQRVGIARAIACGPRFLVADEPVSALDPPVQAQIVNLLLDLRDQMGLAYLLIAHDLRLVRHIADRVAVLYAGRIVEEAPAAALYAEPMHPYTRALLASTPGLRPGHPTPPGVSGEPASPSSRPPGCAFHPRCPRALPACASIVPVLLPAGEGRTVACHLVHPVEASETAVRAHA